MCAPSAPSTSPVAEEETAGPARTSENERRRLENQMRGLGGTTVIGSTLGSTGGDASKGATVLGATS